MIGYGINLRERNGARPKKRRWPADGKCKYQGGKDICIDVSVAEIPWLLCDKFKIWAVDDKRRTITARKMAGPKMWRDSGGAGDD